jgi:O-antigen/teichoic acid export membrane protein
VEQSVLVGKKRDQQVMAANVIERIPDESDRMQAAARAKALDSIALERTATRGAAWQLVGAAWQTAVQLGASAILARVLFPKDFGMLGMAVLTQGLVQRVGDLSAAAGVIAKKDVTQDDLSTAFWLGGAVQCLLFLVTVAIAPLAAWFFETPQVAWVIWAISVTFLFTAAATVPATLLRKRLQFGVLNFIEGAAFAFQSVLAVLLAVVFHMNYWALVVSIVASSLIQCLATILYARWFPSLRFDPSSFRYLFRYGINGLGASLVTYFHNNTDYFLVGKLLGPSLLGVYEFAYRIPHMAYNRLAVPVAGVMFPALSKAQTSNKQFAAAYLKTVQYLAIILFPALGGLAAVAQPAVAVVWGEKWLAVVLPLQILCFRSAILSVTSPIQAVFLCKNRPDIPFKFSLVTLAFTFGAVGGLGFFFGLVGVAAGMLLSTAPNLFLFWLASRMTETPFRRIFATLASPTVSATVSSLLALGAVHWTLQGTGSNLLALAIAVPAGAAGYLLVMCLRYGDMVRDVFQTIRITLGWSPPLPRVVPQDAADTPVRLNPSEA